MSIWKASPVGVTPEIELAGFKVFRVKSELWPEATDHFMGYNLTEMEGRCSSQIVAYDNVNRIGTTRSGRLYKLSDKRVSLSQMGDASYVWNLWCKRNEITEQEDVTDEYLSA